MIVVIGASASGKTQIAKILRKQFDFKKCITTTTRKMRVGETNDLDYHFITKDEFESLIKNNLLVEHALYNNEYYGLQKQDLIKNGLVIMEPTGANELIKLLNKEVFVVYVNTDKAIRKQRMINRGDNLIDIEKRLKNDDLVFSKDNLLRVDLEITNNEQTIEELAVIIRKAYNL